MDDSARYQPEIDGLRAVAIIAAVLFHIKMPGFAGGFVGVDVFFVISGFLISRMLIEELRRTAPEQSGRYASGTPVTTID
jgi:peptidoglycan/LPS O-acetylase OafA/YrhL